MDSQSESPVHALDAPAATTPQIAAPLTRQRLRVLNAWFYLGVPLLFGFLLGWLRVRHTATWPPGVAMAYWMGVALAMTATFDLCCRLVAPLLRRAGLPLWFTLLCGQILAGVVVLQPLISGYRGLLKLFLYPGLVEPNFASPVVRFVQYLPSNTLFWLGINLLFFHVLRMPRLGYLPPGTGAEPVGARTGATAGPPPSNLASETGLQPASPAAAPSEPAFMQRMRADRRGPLLALKAEGHYLRVYTSAGSDLILCRLSDAIAELRPDAGAQVHRSWWVADGALTTGHAQRNVLTLSNGVQVPVSRSYRLAARARGWLQ